ncbi:MAG: hypothetical protein GXP18_11760 [Gammaproteobacteria bacterium]|nr:hypothetical protein [Gammaproteobacteria bacterium]
MDWIQIGSVVLLGAMLIFIFPRMRHAVKNAPKGSSKDWLNYLMILVVVGLFIVFLVQMV